MTREKKPFQKWRCGVQLARSKMTEREKWPLHMCEMAGKKEMLAEIKKAARDSVYLCVCCGRSAKDEERLCAPENLNKKSKGEKK